MKVLGISTFYRPKDEIEWPISASMASKVFSKSQIFFDFAIINIKTDNKVFLVVLFQKNFVFQRSITPTNSIIN